MENAGGAPQYVVSEVHHDKPMSLCLCNTVMLIPALVLMNTEVTH